MIETPSVYAFLSNQTADKFFEQFWPGLAATFIGGIALTVLFFILKERLFAIPTVAGVWESQLTVESTAYRPFNGMQLWYRLILLQSGNQITGTGEKDREISQTVHKRYEGKSRIVTKVYGSIEKRILGSDRIHIFWEENGQRRSTGTFFELRVSGDKHKGNLCGKYYSTAGECLGLSHWQRVF